MPEEVRRSSVQSRRASLAAGRRKSMASNQPDWEVEAPPTPPAGDEFSPRQPTAPVAAPATQEQSPAAQPAESPAAQEPAPAEEKPAPVTHTMEVSAPQEEKRGKTRHTVRFRGSKWLEVLQTNKEDLKSAFLADLKEAAGVEPDELLRVNLTFEDCMIASFLMQHPRDDRSRMDMVHSKLQGYPFSHTCELYPPLEE